MDRRAPITPEQIDTWRSMPRETRHLEFKEAKTQFDNDSLYEYCVAIANEGGGHLLLGVKNAHPREVVGTRAFNDTAKMEHKIYTHINFRVEMHEVNHPNGRVIVCRIPTRPKGTAYHYNGRFLMRCDESLLPMSEDQLRTIFDEGKPNWIEQHTKMDLTAQEVASLLDLKAYFQLLEMPYPSDETAAIDRLVIEQLVDESNGLYSIRKIGALLLSKNLGAFPDLERKAARVIVYNGTDKTSTKLERPGRKGYAVGFEGMTGFIGEQLPQNEVIEGSLRRSVKLVPDFVIRELAANALIHQDFEMAGTSVVIEVYADRVEITNPGKPEIPTDRFIDEAKSRNERFAMLMRKLRICEEKGSGIDRVVRAAELWQVSAPDFRVGHHSTTVVISGAKEFDDLTRDERIRACYQHCVLRYITNEKMTNQTLRERFKLSESKSTAISQIITATVDAQMIKSDAEAGGSRKFARYVPIWS
jgi:ATP-dependent DNA helicase RecG